MRPLVLTVGPLATASATKIGLSQKAAIVGTNYLVLNGAAGSFTANSVCASQTPGGAGTLTLNGTLASSAPTGTAVGYLPGPSYIYITGGSDESGKTFAVVGTRFGGGSGGGSYVTYVVTETITGPNASTVSSLNQYDQIVSITASAATTGAITVGHYRAATLDVARRVIFTSGGNDSAATITLSGTDYAGIAISETITGANAGAASSVLDYLTITSATINAAVATTMTIGTNGVAASQWAAFDPFAGMAQVAIQANVSGTANYTIQQTMDDPAATSNATARASMAWFSHPDTNVVAATASKQARYDVAPTYARVLLNSGTGTVTTTFVQSNMNT